MNERSAITEAELHAYIDGHLPLARQREIEIYLSSRPEEMQRLESYCAQKRNLHALFDPVLDETPPRRVMEAARPRARWYWQSLAAGLTMALIGGTAGWGLRGLGLSAQEAAIAAAPAGFAQRAAVAHAVYVPEVKRPVEVDAAHEDQLVTWLSKRMGAPMKPPHLQALGYALEGGRLLPGERGPVAQFMYRDEAGSRLTLYVSNEIGEFGAASGVPGGTNTDTAFRFANEGRVKVFYWVEGPFGYAISADTDRAALARVSTEVYKQLGAAGR